MNDSGPLGYDSTANAPRAKHTIGQPCSGHTLCTLVHNMPAVWTCSRHCSRRCLRPAEYSLVPCPSVHRCAYCGESELCAHHRWHGPNDGKHVKLKFAQKKKPTAQQPRQPQPNVPNPPPALTPVPNVPTPCPTAGKTDSWHRPFPKQWRNDTLEFLTARLLCILTTTAAKPFPKMLFFSNISQSNVRPRVGCGIMAKPVCDDLPRPVRGVNKGPPNFRPWYIQRSGHANWPRVI